MADESNTHALDSTQVARAVERLGIIEGELSEIASWLHLHVKRNSDVIPGALDFSERDGE